MDAKVLEMQRMKADWESMRGRMEERIRFLEEKNETLTRQKQRMERELEVCEEEKRSLRDGKPDVDRDEEKRRYESELEKVSEENKGILQQNMSLRKEKALLMRQMALRMEDLQTAEEEIERLKAQNDMQRSDALCHFDGTQTEVQHPVAPFVGISSGIALHESTQTDEYERPPLYVLPMSHVGVQCEFAEAVVESVEGESVVDHGETFVGEHDTLDQEESMNPFSVPVVSVSTSTNEGIIVLTKEERENELALHHGSLAQLRHQLVQLEERVKEDEDTIVKLQGNLVAMEKEKTVLCTLHREEMARKEKELTESLRSYEETIAQWTQRYSEKELHILSMTNEFKEERKKHEKELEAFRERIQKFDELFEKNKREMHDYKADMERVEKELDETREDMIKTQQRLQLCEENHDDALVRIARKWYTMRHRVDDRIALARVMSAWKMRQILIRHHDAVSLNIKKCVGYISGRENSWMKHVAFFEWKSFANASKSEKKISGVLQTRVEMIQKNCAGLEKKFSSKMSLCTKRMEKMSRDLHSRVFLVLQQSKKRIESLVSAMKIITDGRDSMKEKLRLAREEVLRLKKENQALGEDLEDARVVQVRMRKECTTLASESDNTKKTMEKMTKKQRKMENELKSYKSRIQDIERAIAEQNAPQPIQASIDMVSGDLKDLKSILGDVMGQWDAVQSNLDTIRMQIPASFDEATAHSIEGLRDRFASTLKEIEEREMSLYASRSRTLSDEFSVQRWSGIPSSECADSGESPEGMDDTCATTSLSHEELISMAFASQLPGATRPKVVHVQRPRKLTHDQRGEKK
eukprot:TRINITY_DN308_c0_g3_i1.p1 TRINITY_DN308_c0_g3~~TRINITY_DN308_c0_g3_i1.p1  ORF type:complete len:813 (-),score=267.33 TRINITY_DN308_c0_g3_i1:1269-3707(-)